MPYKSEAQRRYLHANHPEIAKRWDKEYGNEPRKKALRKRINRRRREEMRMTQ